MTPAGAGIGSTTTSISTRSRVQAITGDPRVYGRVYVSTNGRGVIVGEPRRHRHHGRDCDDEHRDDGHDHHR